MVTINTTTESVTLTVPAARTVESRIGIAVTWDAWAIAVDRPAFLAAVEQHCPAFASLVPECSSPSEAITRAMGRSQGHTQSEIPMRWERVKVAGVTDLATVELAIGDRSDHFRSEGTLRVEINLTSGDVVRVTGDVDTGDMDADAKARGSLAAFLDRYTRERNALTAADITGTSGWLRAVLSHLGALKMSTTQAQYFVRADRDAALEGIEVALAAAGVVLNPLPVLGGPSARGSLHGAGRSLASDAAALLATANAKLGKAKNGKAVRVSLDDVADLEAQVAALKAIADVEVIEVQRTLAKVRETLLAVERTVEGAKLQEGAALLASLGITL